MSFYLAKYFFEMNEHECKRELFVASLLLLSDELTVHHCLTGVIQPISTTMIKILIFFDLIL